MKTNILVIGSMLIAFLSCEKKETAPAANQVSHHEEIKESLLSTHCYLFTNGKDSILLQYEMERNEVKGWLKYDFFEKDGSLGEIEGKFYGDTLKLEYEFMAEGSLSEEEVYFLKKEGNLVRGFGELKTDNDSMRVYVNPTKLDFNDSTPLSHLDSCPDGFIPEKSKEFYRNLKNQN